LKDDPLKESCLKAVIYNQPGEPSTVLQCVEVPIRDPGPGQVLLKMRQMPVVPADLATIRGLYRTPQKTPTVPGYSGQGTVMAVGPGVKSFKEGDDALVLAFKESGWANGAWQSHLVTEETELLAVPAGIALDSSFDFFNTPLTAWVMAVQKMNIQPGQTLLLTAAGSCVGRMLISLAKERKFSVIAVVRRPEQVAEIKALGAAEVICTQTEDIQKRVMALTQLKGVDHCIEAVGGPSTTACFKVLNEHGKMIVFGLLDATRDSEIDIRKLLFYNLNLSGFWLPGWWYGSDIKSRTFAMERTFDLIQKGVLTCPVEKKYPLSQISEAVKHAEKSGNVGRVALVAED
jgi:NADPH:quinone reductase